jgi:N-acetylneuraminate synthase
MRIGDREIGPDAPTFVIAELSGNHHQQLDEAIALVRAAADAGADAVKLQHYTPDTLTIDAPTPPFRVGAGTLWEGRTLYDLYREAMTPWEWYAPLREVADEHGLILFSTPFDRTAVDFLVEQGTPAFKVASFELVDLELISTVASHGLPLIMSTGMATVDEIDEAVRTATDAGATQIALLRCNSSYPAPVEEMDLATIADMRQRWPVVVGLSDHTLDHTAAVVSVALGGRIIEKHVTLDRGDGGPDAAFSLEPHELRRLVELVREAEGSLGGVRYGPSESEQASVPFRRSIFSVADIAEGDTLDRDNIRVIRPGAGLAPRELPQVLGRQAATDIPRGTPLSWDLVR